MNRDPEDFDSLKKLLAWKRHEQPPPGYFNELPRKVWARIEEEESAPSFWMRVLPAVGIKPAVAYAFGLVVCGTLIIGIGSSLKNDPNATLATPLLPQNTPAALGPGDFGVPAGQLKVGFPESNTNPLPLFPGNFQLDLQTQPINYQPEQ